jgi:hypothetical protein
MARSKKTTVPAGLVGQTNAKTKSITLRITPAQASRVAAVRAQCRASGIAWSITAALTAALDDELEKMDKYLTDKTGREFDSKQAELDIA